MDECVKLRFKEKIFRDIKIIGVVGLVICAIYGVIWYSPVLGLSLSVVGLIGGFFYMGYKEAVEECKQNKVPSSRG